jgi:hypothetical protein
VHLSEVTFYKIHILEYSHFINKMFRKPLDFLPVFHLIMCLMKAQKSFGKIAILKTHFGKLDLKFSGMKKNMSLLLIQAEFRHTKHLKMIV